MVSHVHAHPFDTLCQPACPAYDWPDAVTRERLTPEPIPVRDEPLEMMLLRNVAERVERKQGRLTMRFYSGWWHARMAFYDENGQWQLATGLGKILIEALTECLADAEKLEKL